MHRVTNTRQKGETSRALFRVGVVDRDVLEERIDRRAQRGERRHRRLEILARDCIGGSRRGGIERGDQRGFGGFGGVGERFSPPCKGGVGGGCATRRVALDASVGAAAFGVHVAAPYFPAIDNPQNKKFVATFEKKYGRVPSFYAADQYDAIMLIDSAVRAVHGNVHDTAALRAAMMKADFQSLRGKFRFNVNHFPIQDYYIAHAVKAKVGAADFKIDGVEKDGKDAYYHACKMAE